MNERRISDLGLAAYLCACGYEITGLTGSNGRREFVFRDVDERAIFDYYSGTDRTVSAKALFDSHRNLKGLLAQHI